LRFEIIAIFIWGRRWGLIRRPGATIAAALCPGVNHPHRPAGAAGAPHFNTSRDVIGSSKAAGKATVRDLSPAVNPGVFASFILAGIWSGATAGRAARQINSPLET